jgi:hypothetical protein
MLRAVRFSFDQAARLVGSELISLQIGGQPPNRRWEGNSTHLSMEARLPRTPLSCWQRVQLPSRNNWPKESRDI